MINLIVGFIIGYWFAFNKENAQTYWTQFKNWMKKLINKGKTHGVENLQ